ncbi:hypothetical protein HKD37_11G031873 [Glycine soja]
MLSFSLEGEEEKLKVAYRIKACNSSHVTVSTNQQGILDNAVPVLLVDGYNVCGYWMKLKKHFVKGRLDIAHQKLIDELLTFSMLREVKIIVVFVAMILDIIFLGETCVDTWIEKEVAALKEDGCPKVWVVTSDHCHQQVAHGAGAFIWSCMGLVTDNLRQDGSVCYPLIKFHS